MIANHQNETAGGEDVVAIAAAIAKTLDEQAVPARLLGGVAVALRCPTARPPSPLARAYSDLDFATTRKAKGALASALGEHGFEPVGRFNALNGHARMMFEHNRGLHVDVFVEKFEMCHTLALRDRLTVSPETLPLADLMLTKLQVAEVNAKDVGDTVALLCDHELTGNESGINVAYLTGVLSRDWGWWRTVTANLAIVASMAPTLGLEASIERRAMTRLALLSDAINDRRKSPSWRARAALGDRVGWRQMPEEPARN